MPLTRRDVLKSAGALVLASRAAAPVTGPGHQDRIKEDRMNSRHLMTLRLATAATEEISSTPRGTLSISCRGHRRDWSGRGPFTPSRRSSDMSRKA